MRLAKPLEWAEAPDPHPGPGQIRIAVRAASVNPIDWKTISGVVAGGKPMVGTGYLGYDAAGVVDEVGDGVSGVSVGDDVFGRGHNTPGRVRRARLLGGQAAVDRLGGGRRSGCGRRDQRAVFVCSTSKPATRCLSTAVPVVWARPPCRWRLPEGRT
jgi:NADPH:quinone reductase-like Zn-dependent oxidoreductase